MMAYGTFLSKLPYFNPRIALLFFRTPVALGGKKAPRRLSIRTTNMLDSKSQSSVFGHGEFKESVPQMIPTTKNRIWNFDAIYHSSRDISTSGLGGHIAISGCRSLSQ